MLDARSIVSYDVPLFRKAHANSYFMTFKLHINICLSMNDQFFLGYKARWVGAFLAAFSERSCLLVTLWQSSEYLSATTNMVGVTRIFNFEESYDVKVIGSVRRQSRISSLVRAGLER